MDARGGEKWGWTGGFFGATCWILVGAGILLAQGKVLQGLIGVVLFTVAVTVSTVCAPWRNPNTPYWKLMLAGLATPLGSIVWALWCFGDQDTNLVPLLTVFVAVLIPVWQQRHRRWSDFEMLEDGVRNNVSATEDTLERKTD